MSPPSDGHESLVQETPRNRKRAGPTRPITVRPSSLFSPRSCVVRKLRDIISIAAAHLAQVNPDAPADTKHRYLSGARPASNGRGAGAEDTCGLLRGDERRRQVPLH